MFVFGYGSLVRTGGIPALLRGHRRTWGVAMDNSVAIPGYKLWLAPDGSAPAAFVAFLDLVEHAASAVNGLVARVTEAELERLDERERNYDRIEVTDAVEPRLGPTWAYVGSRAGRARLAAGLRSGTAVVASEYLNAVRAGFRALGDEHADHFERSTDLDSLPVRELRRVDLPRAAV